MIVLDTNVVSEFDRPHPSRTVLDWMNRQRFAGLYLTTPTIAELNMGAQQTFLRTGSRKYFEPLQVLVGLYEGRILSFDVTAAAMYGCIVAARFQAGRPILVIDAMIAAICLVNDATLATRNVRDFVGLDLKLVNPFETEG